MICRPFVRSVQQLCERGFATVSDVHPAAESAISGDYTSPLTMYGADSPSDELVRDLSIPLAPFEDTLLTDRREIARPVWVRVRCSPHSPASDVSGVCSSAQPSLMEPRGRPQESVGRSEAESTRHESSQLQREIGAAVRLAACSARADRTRQTTGGFDARRLGCSGACEPGRHAPMHGELRAPATQA